MEGDEDIWSLFDSLSVDDVQSEDQKKVVVENDSKGHKVEECEFCKSKNIVVEDCNYVCQDCCSVLSRFIDMTAEWRFYGGDDNKTSDPARCGMPTNDLLPESSIGSVIGYGTNVSYEMMMLRKYHRWSSMTYKERSLYNIFDGLTIYATNSGIPKTIIEQAKNYYKQLSEMQITRGENRAGLIASSVYMSCKHHGVPRSTKEIAKMFNLRSTTMTKGCKKFTEMMKLHMECSTPINFIERFCSKMNLDQSVRDIAKHVIVTADKLNLICESTPPSIAAASIYLVGIVKKLNFSKKELAICCEISQVTIGKCYKRLHAYRHHLFDEEIE
jgi:transcription initiation factor TFIIB